MCCLCCFPDTTAGLRGWSRRCTLKDSLLALYRKAFGPLFYVVTWYCLNDSPRACVTDPERLSESLEVSPRESSGRCNKNNFIRPKDSRPCYPDGRRDPDPRWVNDCAAKGNHWLIPILQFLYLASDLLHTAVLSNILLSSASNTA